MNGRIKKVKCRKCNNSDKLRRIWLFVDRIKRVTDKTELLTEKWGAFFNTPLGFFTPRRLKKLLPEHRDTYF